MSCACRMRRSLAGLREREGEKEGVLHMAGYRRLLTTIIAAY